MRVLAHLIAAAATLAPSICHEACNGAGRKAGDDAIGATGQDDRHAGAEHDAGGPAMACLPSLKSLNAMKSVHLRAGHRQADPVLLINDDGLLDGVDLRPGAINKGGVSADGRPLIHTLPVGNLQVSEEMMQEERQIHQRLVPDYAVPDLD